MEQVRLNLARANTHTGTHLNSGMFHSCPCYLNTCFVPFCSLYITLNVSNLVPLPIWIGTLSLCVCVCWTVCVCVSARLCVGVYVCLCWTVCMFFRDCYSSVTPSGPECINQYVQWCQHTDILDWTINTTLPCFPSPAPLPPAHSSPRHHRKKLGEFFQTKYDWDLLAARSIWEIGRASCRERV